MEQIGGGELVGMDEIGNEKELQTALAKLCPTLDGDLVCYLSSLLCDALAQDTCHSAEDVEETIGACLQSYDEDLNAAAVRYLCRSLFQQMGPLLKAKQEESKRAAATQHQQVAAASPAQTGRDQEQEQGEQRAPQKTTKQQEGKKKTRVSKKERRAQARADRQKGTAQEGAAVEAKHDRPGRSTTVRGGSADDEDTHVEVVLGSRGRLNRSGTSNDVCMYDLSITTKGRDILVGSKLVLRAGAKYGVVGRNGIGKSTLLRWIVQHKLPGFPTHLSTMLVQQEAEGGDASALATVLQADTQRTALMQERDELLDGQGNPERLSEVYSALQLIEADSAEQRARQILTGLQFSAARLDVPTKLLSGGWRMRVALARALFMQPDILALDEPTNHLDLPAVLWLQRYIAEYAGTVICVSHDGVFLDHFATDIVHFHHAKLDYYPGNFSQFKKHREDKVAKGANLQANLDKKRTHIENSIQKLHRAAKSKSSRKEGDSNKLQQMASRKKQLIKLGHDKTEDGKRWKYSEMGYRPGSIQEGGGHKLGFTYAQGLRCKRLLSEPQDPEIKFTFQLPKDPFVDSLAEGVPLLQLLNVGFAYPGPQPRMLFSEVKLDIAHKARIGLLGRNGTGKSTLFKLLTGQLAPTQGKVALHSQARIAVFAQHHMDSLDLQQTCLQHMTDKFAGKNMKEVELRSKLGHFGLGARASQRIQTLSGGEKARLVFASVLAEKPHILLLDEPTNHLDYDTIVLLIESIQEFNGAVLVVSHHQGLLAEACTQWWELSHRKIKETTFDAYLQKQKRIYEHVEKDSGSAG